MDTPQPLSFSDFLEKMKDPAAADLVRNIKSFIKQFEDRPKGHPVDPDADSAKVQEFMAKSEQLFRAHPVWRGSLPAVLDQAVEGLEKYVMSKIWRETFGVSQEDRDRDERYARLSRALAAFVDLPTLMGVEGVAPDPALLAMAQGELLKMDKYKAPRDKLLCLVNVKTMVENIVQQEAKKGAKIGGADAFFPVFLFIVIRSGLPRLASNVEHIKRFRTLSRLTGQFDFMLCNLESAAMYLDTVNYEHLRISQDEFLARLAAAGIPEADLELRRLQRQRAQQEAAEAEAAAAAGAEGSQSGLSSPRALDAYLRQQEEQIQLQQQQHEDEEGDGGGAGGITAAAGARQQGATDGLLEGAQQEQEHSPGSDIDFSLPSTPAGPAANVVSISASAATMQQRSTASAAARGGAAAGAPAAAATISPAETEAGLSPLPLGTPGGAPGAPEGLTGGLSLSDALRRQLFEEGEGSVAAAPPELPAEPSFVEEMVAEGTQWVLQQEARGLLQRKYPFMYASAPELTVGDVQRVLAGYKDLILRYEALTLSLRRQLGPTTAGTAAGASARQQQPGTGGSGAFLAFQRTGALLTDPSEDALRLGRSAAAGLATSPPAGDDAAAAALLGQGTSPGRRSLLQRITSRGSRSSSKGEVVTALVAMGALSPQRISPAGSPQSGKWRGGEGSGGLLSSLFGTPQRQGGRRSQDGNRRGSRGEEETVQLRPLPAAVTATVTLAAPSSPPNFAPPSSPPNFAPPSSPTNFASRSASGSQQAEQAALLEANPPLTLLNNRRTGMAAAQLTSAEEGGISGLLWGLPGSESEERPRGPLSRGGSAPDEWEEDKRPGPSQGSGPAASTAVAAAASSLAAGRSSEGALASSPAGTSASLGGYIAMPQDELGELEAGMAAAAAAEAAGEGEEEETSEGSGDGSEAGGAGEQANAAAGGAAPPAPPHQGGAKPPEGVGKVAAVPLQPAIGADDDVLAGLQLSGAEEGPSPEPAPSAGVQQGGQQRGKRQMQPVGHASPIASSGSFWHREMMDAATDSPHSRA